MAAPRGERHPNWKGGWRKHGDYIEVLCKGHPHGDHDGYVLLHRLMMEIYLGRYLESWEIVHHIIPIKEGGTNNIENLMLTTIRDHPKEHRVDMSDRKCFECGKNKTWKCYKNGRPIWNKYFDKWICGRCHQSIKIYNKPRKNIINCIN